MTQRGRPHMGIVADLGVHRRTVTRWLNAYYADGLGGLQPPPFNTKCRRLKVNPIV